jgi:hypothetical protein
VRRKSARSIATKETTATVDATCPPAGRDRDTFRTVEGQIMTESKMKSSLSTEN